MKAHRSLTRLDVLRYPADKISLMIASEFLRAAGRAHYPQIVESCFHRARELMGILETIPLNHQAAQSLQSVYRECAHQRLFQPQHLVAEHVRVFSSRVAETFETAARITGSAHA